MRALVIGASGGIGAALVQALSLQGEVVTLSRSGDGLDITDEASIARLMAKLEPSFERIVIATGALAGPGQAPEKSLRALEAGQIMAQFALNAMGPALVVKHALRLLPRDRAAQVGVLSARVGSIGDNALGGWYSYRASKAALNQMIHTAAIEIARSHPLAVVACLHPGTVATAFTADYAAEKVTAAVAADRLLAVLDGLTPRQSGGFYDWAGREVPW
ncbi:SDR family NAD(P)-dependent oxidoreductase [Cypionkella sp.]|jgi:NAD(P)-dependent dehydrogenase (short-subunit alcohol dehydrogenase family)|uniref:SDR family NAD(P)-dependent oxidoreductase n=1 Tax=Cypionkella sp. TaxID=2811411 RepID=UPI0037524EEA